MAGDVLRVLIVDDEEPYRLALRAAMIAQGWTVHEAGSAHDAIDLARREKLDAVVLDFVLPDADGLLVLDAFRRWGVDAPVVALSGSDSPAVAMGFVRAGVVEYLHKDRLSPLRIVHSVRHAVRVHHALAAKPGTSPAGADARPRRAPDDHLDEPPGLDRAPKGATVLVVDDTEDSRFMLRRILAGADWIVVEARTGAEALRLAVSARPDVILLDYLLPDSEGVAVLKEMRAKGVLAPVIALTGHGDEGVAKEFILAGAADFLSKDDLPEYRLLLTLRNAIMLAPAK